MRLDILITEKNPELSRSKAQSLIKGGKVMLNGRIITKPSFECDETDEIIVTEAPKYVGRGGLKLETALEKFGVNPMGFVAVDIGASTGGFTDCLLQRGARKIFAVDSGSNQLVRSLREDERVIVMENFNARNLDTDFLGEECDIAVMDVSFISQKLLYSNVAEVLKDGGIFVSLIKPQFEVGRDYVGKNGIVKDRAAHYRAITNLFDDAVKLSLIPLRLTESPILGGEGNREYLCLFIKNRNKSEMMTDDAIKEVVFGIL